MINVLFVGGPLHGQVRRAQPHFPILCPVPPMPDGRPGPYMTDGSGIPSLRTVAYVAIMYTRADDWPGQAAPITVASTDGWDTTVSQVFDAAKIAGVPPVTARGARAVDVRMRSLAGRLAVWSIVERMDEDGALPAARNPFDGQPVAPSTVAGIARETGLGAWAVRHWLSDVDYWSPYPDHEVIRRLLDLDLDAWAPGGASHDENVTALLHLARLVGTRHMDEWVESWGSAATRYNWSRMTADQRHALTDRIRNARKAMAR